MLYQKELQLVSHICASQMAWVDVTAITNFIKCIYKDFFTEKRSFIDNSVYCLLLMDNTHVWKKVHFSSLVVNIYLQKVGSKQSSVHHHSNHIKKPRYEPGRKIYVHPMKSWLIGMQIPIRGHRNSNCPLIQHGNGNSPFPTLNASTNGGRLPS